MNNPIATYRIQFHKGFSFSDFEVVIPYLKKLGIGSIYASPLMEATPGSTHGYDGVNPHRINPEIGTEEQLRNIVKRLKEDNISWLQDIVPNHMAFHANNVWLADILKNGRTSPYADYFDIVWENLTSFEGQLKVPDYRRFFTVDDLICLNIHLPSVFNEFHKYSKQLLDKGLFQGLRIDHIDGLYDPTGYLQQLRELAGEECYIIVEKILQQHESMPESWTVQGNTGYDFLSMVNNLLTNISSKERLTSFYEKLVGDERTVQEQVIDKKAYILYHHMPGELENLVKLYQSLGLAGKRDNIEMLKKDIADYLIYCPVYRYYDNDYSVMKRDEGKDRTMLKKFYARCMQFTGPLMAKGVEDTVMYTYNRFIGHNEVGDSPENYGLSCPDFHHAMQERQEHWPLSLNATSTHDTKRGEDVRARLNVLTDIKEEWLERVEEWFRLNSDIRTSDMPDKNDEYFIYQSLIGTYPMPGEMDSDFKERFHAYLLKAFREAKRHSNWEQPNEAYENAVKEFGSHLLKKDRPFWKSFEQLHKKVTDIGIIYSLAQTLLKFTCPGIPDIYQGCELWDLSFVDPDNRRAVNYAKREALLDDIVENDKDIFSILWQNRYDAKIKLWLIQVLLKERRKYPELFTKGKYIPLQVEGEYKENVLAFARFYQNTWYAIAVPLHIAELCETQKCDVLNINWKNTQIILPNEPCGKWTDILDITSYFFLKKSFN